MVTTLLATLAIAFAGNEMGNGTDHFQDRPAWFVGREKTIHACVEVAPHFGVDERDVKDLVTQTFQQWVSYVDEKEVERYVIGEPILYARTLEWQNCGDTTDLRILAGIDNDEVRKQKVKYFEPLAFAAVTDKSGKGWSRGFVWIAMPEAIRPAFPNWQKRETLHGVILHELGHVFGVGHVQGTIMDHRLARMIDDHDIFGEALTKIDGRRVLIFKGDVNYDGVLGLGTGPDEDYRVFEWMFGRRVKGKISADFKGELRTKAVLSVRDEAGSQQLGVSCKGGTSFITAGEIFLRQSETQSTWTNNNGGIEFCSMTMKDGKQLPVIIEYSVSNEDNLGPVTLKRIDTGLPRTIFRSRIKGISETNIKGVK